LPQYPGVQYIIPSIIPLADFFMLVGYLLAMQPGSEHITCIYARGSCGSDPRFHFEKEKLTKLIWLVPSVWSGAGLCGMYF